MTAEAKAFVSLVSAWGDVNKMSGSWGVSFLLSLWVEFSYYLLGCMFALLLLYRILSCDPATLLPSSPSLSPRTCTQLTLTFTQFTLTFTQFTPTFTPHFHPACPQFPPLTLTQLTWLSPSSPDFHPTPHLKCSADELDVVLLPKLFIHGMQHLAVVLDGLRCDLAEILPYCMAFILFAVRILF